jgi:hypothetical protein
VACTAFKFAWPHAAASRYPLEQVTAGLHGANTPLGLWRHSQTCDS